jgi:hypothetical protein
MTHGKEYIRVKRTTLSLRAMNFLAWTADDDPLHESMWQTDSAGHHPFSVGSRLGCDNRIVARPYEVNVNRVEKFFEHGRVLLIPVLGISLPLCKPA